MNEYLGNDRQNATRMMTATYLTAGSLTRRIHWVGYKLYIDNFSPLLTYLMTWQ